MTVKEFPLWDPVVRLCHWSFVAIFAANYFTLEPGNLIHQILGYVAGGLVVARCVWGGVSRGHARFSSAALSLRAFRQHYNHLKARRLPVTKGHNPFGWLMLFLVLLLFAGLALTGFMLEEVDAFFGNSLLETIHALLADVLYGMVLVHVAAVLLVGWYGRISLIPPMIHGKRKIKH